jgi:hypothetical protein
VSNPEDAPATKNILDIFDRVAPEKYVPKKPLSQTSQTQPATQPKPAAPETPPAPVQPIEKPQETAPDVEPKPSEKPPEERHLPSFIEKALEIPEVKPPAAVPAAEEWPEEMPVAAPDQQKENYRKWRKDYKTLKEKVSALESRPALDDTTSKKLSYLENRNRELEAVANRMSVEGHAEFQNNIIRPMQSSWNQAATVLKQVGGDPEELARALRMQPKDQFKLIDEILQDVPESAKARINTAITNYQAKDEQRRAWLSNLPKAMEHLRQQDLKRQYAFLDNQKKEMGAMYDQCIARLRDEAKVELLQRSNDPDSSWWNEQADQIESVGRGVFVDNTDMGRLAMACLLAPMADVYRKLWIQTRTELGKKDRIMSDRYGSEPTISESGGNVAGTPTIQEDLKRPLADVFLRELRKAAHR